MQLYLKKPEGVKPLFSRHLIQLSLELHIEPKILYAQMFRLRQPDTPSLQHLWRRYSGDTRRLARDVKRLRQMDGFGTAGAFYEGVATSESFEKEYRPIDADSRLTPMMLTMILDLYYRLTPVTMVAETPEVGELHEVQRPVIKALSGVSRGMEKVYIKRAGRAHRHRSTDARVLQMTCFSGGRTPPPAVFPIPRRNIPRSTDGTFPAVPPPYFRRTGASNTIIISIASTSCHTLQPKVETQDFASHKEECAID